MTAHFVDLLDELKRRSLRMASLVIAEDVIYLTTGEIVRHHT